MELTVIKGMSDKAAAYDRIFGSKSPAKNKSIATVVFHTKI